MKIGRQIKYYRTLHNLTQSEVAELSGINEKYLGRLERNESIPTIDKVEQLCTAFDIRVSDLLTIRPEKMVENVQIDNIDSEQRRAPHVVFYCNCCGCTFTARDHSEIICPECGCHYDEENDYIEKSYVYL